ncbi:MAG: restriction endonuclease subunit S [Bradymonadales bacterium]
MVNWQTKKLSDITTLIKDGTHGTHQDVVGGIPLLSAKDINNGTVNLVSDARLISKDDFNSIHKSYKLCDGDILLTIVGSLGRVAAVKNYHDNYTFQRSVAILRFSEELDSRFAYYTLTEGAFQKELLKRESKGAQGGVYLGDISKVKIQVPEKPEQERIVGVLEVWDEYIKKLEQKIALKEQLKKGLMQRYFAVSSSSEGVVELQEFVKNFSTGLNPRQNFSLGNGGNRYITIKNISDGKLNLNNAEFVDDKAIAMISKRSKLAKNDVIMSSIGNIGEAYLLREDPVGWNINESVFSLKPDEQKVLPEYLYYLVTSEFAKRFFDNHMTGSSFKSIKMKDLKSMPVRQLSLNQQAEIVKVLYNIDSQLTNLSSQLINVKLQKRYLLKNLITGTIRTPETLTPKGVS